MVPTRSLSTAPDLLEPGNPSVLPRRRSICHIIQPVFRNQPREKFLRKILGVVGGVSRAPDKGVERIPIACAQRREGITIVPRLSSRGKDDAPAGRGKTPPPWRRRAVDREGHG